ncbi:hypothetical protein H5410_059765 [Solanum commersonii]|uniref:Uncharacterized protein n=1 Tax=Solanum commersonii TaxID=4109 RepID=A0A9J5W3M8_SOLCO|nr:hypothetical protein H5410_059765 [Solanum commersonii]
MEQPQVKPLYPPKKDQIAELVPYTLVKTYADRLRYNQAKNDVPISLTIAFTVNIKEHTQSVQELTKGKGNTNASSTQAVTKMSRQQQEQGEKQMNVAKKSGKKITATPPQVDPQVPVNN